VGLVDVPTVDAAVKLPVPIVEWEDGVLLDGLLLDAELLPAGDVGPSVSPDDPGLADPSLSACAIPDPLVSTAPTPTVTAAAPSHTEAPVG